MDRGSARCVAMMSIKPQYAFRLLSGEKRVEFRRRSAAKRITHIVVYATRPVGAVVGVLEIDDLTEGTPSALWQAFSNVGGICRADFFEYFSGSTTGVAYIVGKAWSCVEAQELGDVGLPKVPPQAVQYLDDDTVERLKVHRSTQDADYESWLTRQCSRRALRARS